MNLLIITLLDNINGFKFFIKCKIILFYKNTENVKGLKKGKGWGRILLFGSA
jgi:hypothetical protein